MNNDVEPYPPANLAEPEPDALVRLCDTIRLFLWRRYGGEIRERGLVFLAAIFGEMLSMALAVQLANCQDPADVEAQIANLAEQVRKKVRTYERAAQRSLREATDQPGPSLPSIPSRLM